jgi:hypothetical protein
MIPSPPATTLDVIEVGSGVLKINVLTINSPDQSNRDEALRGKIKVTNLKMGDKYRVMRLDRSLGMQL